MKYVISVSKTYKHRGYHLHKRAKKHWHVYYYDEDMNLHCDQVNWFHAMYYKGRKYKRRNVTCPNCRTTYLRLVRKEKDLLKLECPDCFETYKDLYEEFLENS